MMCVTDEPGAQIHILEVLNLMLSNFYVAIDFRDNRKYHFVAHHSLRLKWIEDALNAFKWIRVFHATGRAQGID